jgi:hypothetical protein
MSVRSDYEYLLGTFEFVIKVKSATYREYLLTRCAPQHGIPRAEMRRLYKVWLSEMAAAVGGEADA